LDYGVINSNMHKYLYEIDFKWIDFGALMICINDFIVHSDEI